MSLDNYRPLQNGISNKFSQSISYSEQDPSSSLQEVIHCFWTLKNLRRLSDDFTYTVMPDACIDIIFDIENESDPIIMTPHMHIENLKLGRAFHYIGIRFRPGVFADTILSARTIVGEQQQIDRIADLSLVASYSELRSAKTKASRYKILKKLAYEILASGIVTRNIFVENTINDMQLGLPIDAIAEKVGYSSRQLRRKVIEQTGFSLIQLQRILRFQMTLSSQDTATRFADQSHLIKEFKAITGVSYKSFIDEFK